MSKSRFPHAIVLFAFVSLLSNNCGGDNPVSVEDSLVGTWAMTKMTITTSSGARVILPNEIAITVTFKSDHTYEDTTVFDQSSTYHDSGTWSVSGNTLTSTDSDGEKTIVDFAIEGNKLTTTETGKSFTVIAEFIRQ